MVSREYLQELQQRPSPFTSVLDRAAAEAFLVSYLDAGIPGWDPSILSDNLRRALPLTGEAQVLRDRAAELAWESGFLALCPADVLPLYGVEFGIPAHVGEDPEDYRVRLANSGPGRSDSSLRYYEQAVRAFMPSVADLQVARYSPTNKIDLKVYALKAGYTALTGDEDTLLTAYMNRQETDEPHGYLPSAGRDIHVEAVGQTAYEIALTVRHPSSVPSATVLADVRRQVYAWQDENQRIGRGVYRSAIQRAAFAADVVDVAISKPSADLAPAEGAVYVCPQDTTNVVIAAVAV